MSEQTKKRVLAYIFASLLEKRELIMRATVSFFGENYFSRNGETIFRASYILVFELTQ